MICIVGSRIVGNCREDSDLDIAIQYKGDIREDDVFNELMVEPLYIYNFKVDFIPYSEAKGNFISLEDDTFIVLYEKENKVEYCKEKMIRHLKKDRLLMFVFDDLVRRKLSSAEALMIIFNSYVLEDFTMEYEYSLV
jgi:Polymerase beta, Nucleotidyltransferase